LLLPFALGAWINIIEKVGELKNWRLLSLVVLCAAYVITISLLYVGSGDGRPSA